MSLRKRVVILGMGGTIAGRAGTASDNIGYTAAQLSVGDLLRSVPGAIPAQAVELEQVAQLDSKDMGLPSLFLLAQRVCHWLSLSDVQGVVITHGTDTLEETAYFLQQVCSSAKPVVLTCAMRPTTAFSPDGPQNLRDALSVALHRTAAGVVVVCAGRVHRAVDVQKNHTYQLDAFTSGDAGCIAYVEEGELRQVGGWPVPVENRSARTLAKFAAILPPNIWPRVEIVMNYVGASGATVDALMALGLQGIVVAGTGNGTIHHSLETALLRAKENGVVVIRSTRCANGRVLPIANALFPDSQGLSPVKARIDLILRLLAI